MALLAVTALAYFHSILALQPPPAHAIADFRMVEVLLWLYAPQTVALVTLLVHAYIEILRRRRVP